MGNTPNPDNFQTSQNFKIDIEKIYSDFIQEIDANRSVVNVNIQIANNSSTSIKKLITESNSIKVEDTPQESRMHCFLRLIGFPVVSSDLSRYYNPGFDNIDGDKQIAIDDKYDIADSVSQDFKKFSFERENYVNSIKKIWEIRPATITASALALSSGVHTRVFSLPVKTDIDPFNFKITDQQATCDFSSQIGENSIVQLTDYVDAAGNKPDPSGMFKTRAHYIRPFMVDPRIDFTCSPSSRKIGVPFANSKTELLISENTFVKRPLIEKIIRERFTIQDDSSNSSAQQNIKDIILTIPTITDQTLISQVTSDINKLDDRIQFQKYLFILAAMCKELVRAQIIMKTVQSSYYWLPLPSSTGPEGGSSINGIIISSTLPAGGTNNFITAADKSLINATLRQAANKFNAQTIAANGVPDVGGFAFDAFKLTFGDDTSQAMGDVGAEELDALNSKRDKNISEANKALRTTEIIMGEFSGLGLCDIIAVMGALYVMPKEDLLGFLDTDAFVRMIIQLDIDGLSNPGIETAQKSFLARVRDFYSLMDDIYKQLSLKNGLST